MSLVAFRRDTEDPEIVRQFAELVGVEDRLKMLCLMTLADVEAVSRETLTPWKEELLWRLYVDTYNFLTLCLRRRGDRPQPVGPRRRSSTRARPTSRPTEVEGFLEGLPRRYLQLFPRKRSTSTCGWRGISAPSACRPGSGAATTVWELTVLTRDRPFLFSNISGVLSSFGMDILRGFAFTKPDGLVVDMFHFSDEERFLELNPGRRRAGRQACSRT